MKCWRWVEQRRTRRAKHGPVLRSRQECLASRHGLPAGVRHGPSSGSSGLRRPSASGRYGTTTKWRPLAVRGGVWQAVTGRSAAGGATLDTKSRPRPAGAHGRQRRGLIPWAGGDLTRERRRAHAGIGSRAAIGRGSWTMPPAWKTLRVSHTVLDNPAGCPHSPQPRRVSCAPRRRAATRREGGERAGIRSSICCRQTCDGNDGSLPLGVQRYTSAAGRPRSLEISGYIPSLL